jgi:hypothetical protein
MQKRSHLYEGNYFSERKKTFVCKKTICVLKKIKVENTNTAIRADNSHIS